jgi:hypothetical protein
MSQSQNEIMEATKKALASIHRHMEAVKAEGGDPVAGSIDCPVCGAGNVQWLVRGKSFMYHCTSTSCVYGSFDG